MIVNRNEDIAQCKRDITEFEIHKRLSQQSINKYEDFIDDLKKVLE